MENEFSPKLIYDGQELKAKIQEAAEKVINEYDANAGWIVSVVHNEQTIFSKAYGYADIENKILNSEINTAYSIASTGKQLCAAAFLQNWELQGRPFDELKTRDLNDVLAELEELSPEFSIRFRLDDRGFHEPVTVWNLLTHTAGLEDSYVNMFADIGEDLSRFKLDPRLFNRMHLIDDSCSVRVYPPNVVHSYSNSGYVIIGYLLELLARKSYPDALRETIFNPMAMNGSTACPSYEKDAIHQKSLLPDSDPAKIVLAKPHKHIKKKDGTTKVQPLPDKENCNTIVYAPGSSVLTCPDMNKWMIMLLNRGYYQGKQILLPNTIHYMIDKQFSPFSLSQSAFNCGLRAESKMEYGNLEVLGHGGGLPGFLTDEILIPQFKMGIFVSTNAGIAKGIREIGDSIMEGIFKSFSPQQQDLFVKKPNLIKDTSKFNLKQYAGCYSVTRGMESHYTSILWKVFAPEIKLRASIDKQHLIDSKGNKYYPVEQVMQQNNVSFLFEAGPKKEDKKEKIAQKYAGISIKSLGPKQTDYYLFSPAGVFRKRKWHERAIIHRSLLAFVLGGSFVQLGYSGMKYALEEKLSNWPKASALATGVAACIFAFPTILGIHISTCSFTQAIARRLPLGAKSALRVSQLGLIVLGWTTASTLDQSAGVQDTVAVLNSTLFTGFLMYWSLRLRPKF